MSSPAGELTVGYVLGTAAGGTGRHVAMLARGCAARGAAVLVYGPAAAVPEMAGSPRPDRGPAAVRVAPVDIAGRPRPAQDAAAVRRLRRLLARDRPDVLHAHGLRAGALAALALGVPDGHRPPLAVTVHNAPPAGRAAATVYAVLELLVARRASAVLAVSADLEARMRARGARLAGRALVPPPAAEPVTAAAAAAVRAELAAGQPIVLAVGRLAGQKGFGTLIEAAARWQRAGPGAAAGGRPAALLVIAGDGPLREALRDQAAAAGVAVRFLGQRADVPALLAAADVVAVPSAWEGQPLIVQEALRAGRPLVATPVGGVADLTGPGGAVLVPPGDAAALAAAVTRLLDEPAAAAAQAAAARERAARLPTEDMAVDQVLRLYRGLARGGAVGPARLS